MNILTTNTAVDNGSSQGDATTTDAPPDIGSTNTAVDNGSSQADGTSTDAPSDIGSTNTAVDNGSSQGDDATTDAPPDIGSTNTADLTTEMYTTHSYMYLGTILKCTPPNCLICFR